jgi:four helix bundle protein
MAFRFLKFKVYQDAKNLHRKVVFLTKNCPREFLYLKDQLRRSSLYIVLSIAEGSAKSSDKDFNRFIGIALGSANETGAGLDVSFEEGLITKADFENTMTMCREVIDQLGGFSKKLKSKCK